MDGMGTPSPHGTLSFPYHLWWSDTPSGCHKNAGNDGCDRLFSAKKRAQQQRGSHGNGKEELGRAWEFEWQEATFGWWTSEGLLIQKADVFFPAKKSREFNVASILIPYLNDFWLKMLPKLMNPTTDCQSKTFTFKPFHSQSLRTSSKTWQSFLP